MHKKIKQRLSLTYSTTPSSKSSPPDTPTSNQSDPTPPPRRHKKKRSLVGSAFKHLNLTLHHGHHHHDNHDHPVKNTTLIQLSDDQNGGLPRPRLIPSRLRKSLSFSHGHGNKKRASLLPTTTKIKSRYISRSNSITNTKSPIAEEDTIEIDDPFEFSDLDAGISPPLTLSPNKLWSSKSSTLHRHSTPFLPPPASPPQSGSPRGFAEHEKRTLIEQMRQLQASMVQLGNMLTNQDKDLNIEKGKNSQLTEQVNNLADENMALRQQIKKARQDRNSVWQELQLKMLAERTRRDKNLLLTNQVNELTQQKDGLSAYSQKLVEQLTQEKQKTYALTMRVKKYSKTVKRNVKSLHKKTSSLSGLSFYRNALEDISSDPSLVNSLTEIKDDKSDSVSPTVHVQSVIIESPLPEEEAMTPLQQKQAELKELEAQTLDILNQLKEETRMLLDDTRGLSKRSNKRLGNTKKKSSKKKRRKKTLSADEASEQARTHHVITHTETKTKRKTKIKTKGTINGSNIEMNTSLIETKTETKIKVKTEDKSSCDIVEEPTQEGQKNEANTNETTQTKAQSVSSEENEVEWYSDEENEGKKQEEKEDEMSMIQDEEDDADLDDAFVMNEVDTEQKQEVDLLQKADAPLSLVFAAFKKYKACEDVAQCEEEEEDSENESSGPPTPVEVAVKNEEDGPSVSSLFANFNGYDDDEDDETVNAGVCDLWD
eukprot:259585_1